MIKSNVVYSLFFMEEHSRKILAEIFSRWAVIVAWCNVHYWTRWFFFSAIALIAILDSSSMWHQKWSTLLHPLVSIGIALLMLIAMVTTYPTQANRFHWIHVDIKKLYEYIIRKPRTQRHLSRYEAIKFANLVERMQLEFEIARFPDAWMNAILDTIAINYLQRMEEYSRTYELEKAKRWTKRFYDCFTTGLSNDTPPPNLAFEDIPSWWREGDKE